jgi:acetyl-CoA C-acetyltransferase
MMALDPRTPVLIGCAQYVDRTGSPAVALSPLDMLARVAKDAMMDAGAADIAGHLDHVAVVRLFADSAGAYKSPFGTYTNLPRSLANRIGAAPRHCIYGPVGGNTPQMLVNLFAEKIAAGEMDAGLIAGCEALRTQAQAQKQGLKLDWSDQIGDAPEVLGDDKMMISMHEANHGITFPVNVYPLFENALGAHAGRTPRAQREHIGALMAGFSEVAATNPFAMLPVARTAEEIITPTETNRYIGYPYTKYLNANMFVDQAAATIIMSAAKADAVGIAEDKRVYLHGCADTVEKWTVSERVNYYSSPAIRIGAKQALGMAGISVDALQHIDIYSCFSAAVQIAADEIGLPQNDPRGLTLTGGLPYFGGPGNNYSLHAIAEALMRCRAAPGSYGFVFANGGYLTKHSFGVYNATPPAMLFRRANPASYQQLIDAMPSPTFETKPAGAATIETFTVIHDKGLPAFAIIIGRLEQTQARFLAVSRDPEMMADMIDAPVVGRAIMATPGVPVNTAVFA